MSPPIVSNSILMWHWGDSGRMFHAGNVICHSDKNHAIATFAETSQVIKSAVNYEHVSHSRLHFHHDKTYLYLLRRGYQQTQEGTYYSSCEPGTMHDLTPQISREVIYFWSFTERRKRRLEEKFLRYFSPISLIHNDDCQIDVRFLKV